MPAAMMKLLCSCPSGRSSPMRVIDVFHGHGIQRETAVRIRHAQAAAVPFVRAVHCG